MPRAARLVVMMIRPPVAVVISLFAAIGVAQAGAGDVLHPLFRSSPSSSVDGSCTPPCSTTWATRTSTG